MSDLKVGAGTAPASHAELERDHLDEVQLLINAQALSHARVANDVKAPADQIDRREARSGHTAIPHAVPDAKGAQQSRIETVKRQRALADGLLDRPQFEASLVRMAANRYSPESQQAVMAQLQRVSENLDNPGGAEAMAWATAKLAQVAPKDRTCMAALRAFLAERGFALRPGEPVAAQGYQLDRATFVAQLDAIAQGSHRNVKSAQRRLSAMVVTLVDPRDVFWAKSVLTQRLARGAIDPAVAQPVYEQLANKVNGRPSHREVALAMRDVRRAMAAPDDGAFSAAMGRLMTTLHAARKDDAALHLAQRRLRRELALLQHDLENPSSAVRPHHARLFHAHVSGWLEPRLAGTLDAYTEQRTLRRRLRDGGITEHEYYGLRAALLVSHTRDDYVAARELALQQIALLQADQIARLSDALADMDKEAEEARRDDEQRELELREDLARREDAQREREVQQTRIEHAEHLAAQHRVLEHQADAESRQHTTRHHARATEAGQANRVVTHVERAAAKLEGVIAQATDPSAKASAENALSAAQSALGDVEPPPAEAA